MKYPTIRPNRYLVRWHQFDPAAIFYVGDPKKTKETDVLCLFNPAVNDNDPAEKRET
jgi:hypothetical protein